MQPYWTLRRRSSWIWGAEITAGIVGDLLPVGGDMLGVVALGDLRLIPAPFACRIDVAGTDLEHLLLDVRRHQILDELLTRFAVLTALHEVETHRSARAR